MLGATKDDKKNMAASRKGTEQAERKAKK